LPRLIAAAFLHDEVDHPTKSLRSSGRMRDMDHAGQQGEQQRRVGRLHAECAAERFEICLPILNTVADRHIHRLTRRAGDARMTAQGESRRGRQKKKGAGV